MAPQVSSPYTLLAPPTGLILALEQGRHAEPTAGSTRGLSAEGATGTCGFTGVDTSPVGTGLRPFNSVHTGPAYAGPWVEGVHSRG